MMLRKKYALVAYQIETLYIDEKITALCMTCYTISPFCKCKLIFLMNANMWAYALYIVQCIQLLLFIMHHII